jgi:hypothetical protein
MSRTAPVDDKRPAVFQDGSAVADKAHKAPIAHPQNFARLKVHCVLASADGISSRLFGSR